MRWFTANIGVHHIHHLCSRIPYYRLPLVLRDYPELGVFGRLTLIQSFRCVRLVLWDEGQQRLVSFHEVRQRYALVRGRRKTAALYPLSRFGERKSRGWPRATRSNGRACGRR
jgi:omega-6 fatty acid desaturase (delta-12 desaturase)